MAKQVGPVKAAAEGCEVLRPSKAAADCGGFEGFKACRKRATFEAQ